MKRFLKPWILFFLFLAAAARAEDNFHVGATVEDHGEGGRVEKLVVRCGQLQYNLPPPRGWYRRADETARKIIFTDPSGKTAIVVSFQPAAPALPGRDLLQARALQDNPGAQLLQSGPCSGSFNPGYYFDLVRFNGRSLSQKIRQAFLGQPVGQIQVFLSTTADDFDHYKPIFMGMVRDLRVKTVPASST